MKGSKPYSFDTDEEDNILTPEGTEAYSNILGYFDIADMLLEELGIVPNARNIFKMVNVVQQERLCYTIYYATEYLKGVKR